MRAAAEAAGVSEKTLWRWLQEAAFKEALQAAQRSVVDSAVGKLQAANEKAVDTLIKNLDSENDFASNAAALAILNMTQKAIEQAELIERVKRLEALLEGKKLRRA
jgi:hypothetical protein